MFDAMGRNKFDSNGLYITPDDRGDADLGMMDFMNTERNKGGGGGPTFDSLKALEHYIYSVLLPNANAKRFLISNNGNGSFTVSWMQPFSYSSKSTSEDISEIGEVVVGMKRMSETLYFGTKSNSSFNVNAAVNTLNNNAYASHNSVPQSEVGSCARYVRYAVEAGFGMRRDQLTTLSPRSPVPARDWGPFLQGLGFRELSTSSYLKGDIVVMQGYPGGSSDRNGVPYGHIAMYNGNQWVSYWYQKSIYANSSYRNYNPVHFIYRPN